MSSAPFQLGILADLAGSRSTELGDRRFQALDRDSLDAVIRRLEPRAELGLPFCESLTFGSWSDFHPDSIAERTPALATLVSARTEGDPGAMRELLAEAGATVDATEPEPAPTEEERAAPPEPVPPDSGLLDSLVSGAETREGGRARPRRFADPELESIVAEIAEESDSGVDFAALDRLRAAIDRELGARMRAILHHPAVQALEATWRGIRELVRAADTDGAMRIWLLDVTLDELLDESAGAALEQRVYEERAATPGADRFDLLIADYTFGAAEESLAALTRLGALASKAEVPVLTGAGEELAATGQPPPAAFTDLRSHPAAARIGLCYPRVLLRLPYGPDTDPLDSFEFDEAEDSAERGDIPYLWGNAPMIVARAVAQAVSLGGGLDSLPRYAALEGLPVHVYRAEGETRSRHPVEHVFTEGRIRELVERGLLPIVAVTGSDEARLVSLRSLSGVSLIS